MITAEIIAIFFFTSIFWAPFVFLIYKSIRKTPDSSNLFLTALFSFLSAPLLFWAAAISCEDVTKENGICFGIGFGGIVVTGLVMVIYPIFFALCGFFYKKSQQQNNPHPSIVWPIVLAALIFLMLWYNS